MWFQSSFSPFFICFFSAFNFLACVEFDPPKTPVVRSGKYWQSIIFFAHSKLHFPMEFEHWQRRSKYGDILTKHFEKNHMSKNGGIGRPSGNFPLSANQFSTHPTNPVCLFYYWPATDSCFPATHWFLPTYILKVNKAAFQFKIIGEKSAEIMADKICVKSAEIKNFLTIWHKFGNIWYKSVLI